MSVRSNNDVIGLFAGTQQVGTVTCPNQTNPYGRGIKVFVNVTSVGGAGTVTVTIQGIDPVSGVAYTALASTAIAATGLTVLTVYPGLPAAANASANDVLPRQWNVKAVVAANAVAFTVGASVIV